MILVVLVIFGIAMVVVLLAAIFRASSPRDRRPADHSDAGGVNVALMPAWAGDDDHRRHHQDPGAGLHLHTHSHHGSHCDGGGHCSHDAGGHDGGSDCGGSDGGGGDGGGGGGD